MCPVRALYSPEGGTRTWESVCDQQRRHTEQLQRKGDFARGATYVELVTLLELLGSAPLAIARGGYSQVGAELSDHRLSCC